MALETTEKPAARLPLDTAVRRDTWWIKPLLTVLGLGFFAVYATWRAFENRWFENEPYLSPFYSPHIKYHLEIAGYVVSPAFFILIFPLSFRLTCYYYRQAYYRSFFWDPPACAVPEPSIRKRYRGEKTFPLVLQNIHRYTMYVAVLFLFFLWYDALKAFVFHDRFGVRLGSLIMLANVVLLTGYTFGCHSLRHLVGGKLDCFTCPHLGAHGGGGGQHHYQLKPGYKAWKIVTMFNRNHMEWAWTSLFGVILTDFYIRLVATGTIPDLTIF